MFVEPVQNKFFYLPNFIQAVVYLDRKLIERLIHQLDAVVTVFLICIVVVLTILASVFAAVQVLYLKKKAHCFTTPNVYLFRYTARAFICCDSERV